MTGPCWHVTEPQNAAAFLAGGSRHQQVAQDYSCSVGVAEGQQEALASSGGGASRNLGTWKLRFKVRQGAGILNQSRSTCKTGAKSLHG
eukprot:1161468-Pelagomonas_calceolata.AAC.7